MFKTLREKITLSGMVVLGVGVALLIFTFISAYGFLAQGLSIASSDDFVQTFGAALAPLIATCIRLMYLGVMGWVGSLLTIRGVTILVHAPKTEVVATVPAKMATPQPQQKTVATAKKAALEPRKEQKGEPEVIVIPPEQVQKADLQQS
ncbi:MAG: hypothetical protein NZ932_02735 [Candidatus Bathyarchaeota archaeon]|nr:hypothetical protein [Candidatus Bathyarchaeota archaeon]MDW8041147.1 hypothetical protein [Nitrososphaerota archaeon]